jgi:hypothetical protein
LVYVETLNLYRISFLWAKGKTYKPTTAHTPTAAPTTAATIASTVGRPRWNGVVVSTTATCPRRRPTNEDASIASTVGRPGQHGVSVSTMAACPNRRPADEDAAIASTATTCRRRRGTEVQLAVARCTLSCPAGPSSRTLVRHSQRACCARGRETGASAASSSCLAVALEVCVVVVQMGELLARRRL